MTSRRTKEPFVRNIEGRWNMVTWNFNFQNEIALLFLTKHEISDRGLLIFFLVAAWRFPQCDLAVQPDCLSAIADPKKCSAILRRRVRSTAEAQTVFCIAGSTCSVFYDVRRLSDGDPSSLVCSIGIPHISIRSWCLQVDDPSDITALLVL